MRNMPLEDECMDNISFRHTTNIFPENSCKSLQNKIILLLMRKLTIASFKTQCTCAISASTAGNLFVNPLPMGSSPACTAPVQL